MSKQVNKKTATTTVPKQYTFINYKNIFLFCMLSVFVYFFLYSKKAKENKQMFYDDTSLLGGDEWEYQSMGVNYATGHGFPVFGCVEPFEKYKMTRAWSKDYYNYYYNEFTKAKEDHFYRTPGYPFFLGLVYKIYGVSPLKAKQLQLLMLVIIASFLPFIGYYYWKLPGFITSLISGILFMNEYYTIVSDLMTESLIMFSIFLIVIAFMWHQHKKNILTSIVLGLLMAVALLVKGSLVYMPPLFFIYFLYQSFKKNESYLNTAVILLVCVFTILPWSKYASKKAGKQIVLSTQAEIVMPDGNNELTFESGGWNRLNPNDTNFFYNKAAIKDLPSNTKLKIFFEKYYDKIPIMIYNKIRFGFELVEKDKYGKDVNKEFVYIKLSVLLLIFELLQLLINKIYSSVPSKEKQFKWLSLAAVVIMGIAWFQIFPMLCLLATLFIISLLKGTLKDITIPVPAFIFLLSIIGITIVIFGYARFTYVIDFLYIQTALIYMWNSAKTVYSWIPK